MAIISFSIDEALNILWENIKRPDIIKDIKPTDSGLEVSFPLGLTVNIKQESYSDGILKLKIETGNFLSETAYRMGNASQKIDSAIKDFDFIKRIDKSLLINLNSAIQRSKVRGISIKSFDIGNNFVKMEL